MARLFVPPRVAEQLRNETLQFAAVIEQACHQDYVCKAWTKELQRLDPLLSMVRAPDRQIVGTPLVPGAYHVKRDNPGAPPSLIPVLAEDGSPMHPPGRLLEQLKGMDSWNTDVASMQRRIRAAEEDRAEREKLARREERQAAILDQYKAVTNASVSMNPDVPWVQNVSPAARRERAAKQAERAKKKDAA